MKKNKKIHLALFTTTLYISALTIGGGYVIVPLLRKKIVEELKWISEEEMLDMIAIAQSSPGAIAVNASLIIGYRMAGISGAFVTLLGTVLPPFTILAFVSLFYTAFRDNRIVGALLKGMQAGVAAVIADVVITMAGGIIKDRELSSALIMIGAFLAAFFLKINIVLVILACAAIGLVLYMIRKNKEGRN